MMQVITAADGAPPQLSRLIELACLDSRLARDERASVPEAGVTPHVGEFAKSFVAYTLGEHDSQPAQAGYARMRDVVTVIRVYASEDLMPALTWMAESPEHRGLAFRLFEWRRKRESPVGKD